MSRTHHHPGLLFVGAPCAGHQPTTDQGSKEIVTSVESGATSPQNALNAQAALLRGQARIDTQRTKNFCCKAAGIIAPLSRSENARVPHGRLRWAAPADTTLIASDRPPAQHVKGYAHPPFYAPTSNQQAVCDCIANTIHSILAGNAANAFATVEQMVLEIHDALLQAGELHPDLRGLHE